MKTPSPQESYRNTVFTLVPSLSFLCSSRFINSTLIGASSLFFMNATVKGDTPISALVTGYNTSGYVVYAETTPGELAVTPNSTMLLNALGGDSSHAGGNVELYTASDSATNVAFKDADHVLLELNMSGTMVTLSSLNGHDWFDTPGGNYDTTFGANNLANRWFNDFADELKNHTPLVIGNEQALFESYRDNGGFQRVSDPNVSYVEVNGQQILVGLGGFIDIHDQAVALIAAATGQPLAAVDPFVSNGIQSSEVVLINGVASYGFSATPSGVRLNDGVDSYNGNYEVTNVAVPEPSSAILLGLGSLSLLLRRKR